MERDFCSDCLAEDGEMHEPGCDTEECPFCHKQLLSCNCSYEYFDLDPEKEPTYSTGLSKEQEEKWWDALSKKGRIPYGSESLR